MKRLVSLLLAIATALMMFAAAPAVRSYAGGGIEDCLDLGDTTIRIPAGSTYKMRLRAVYDYTYYIAGATSSATFLE